MLAIDFEKYMKIPRNTVIVQKCSLTKLSLLKVRVTSAILQLLGVTWICERLGMVNF